MQSVLIGGGKLSSPINMRKTGSTSSQIIAQIPQGSEAELLANSGTWSLIRWNGWKGYIRSEFIQQLPEDSSPSEAPSATSEALISVPRSTLETAYAAIGRCLGHTG